jgi:hypothetical protein
MFSARKIKSDPGGFLGLCGGLLSTNSKTGSRIKKRPLALEPVAG